MARRRHASAGALPALLRAIGRSLRWFWEHPQPAAVLLIVGGALSAGWWTVEHSDAFRVTAITFSPADVTFDVPKSVLGQRLWDVDLEGLARQLKAQRPTLKRVRVIRLAPNTLHIESLARLPVAQVRLGSWFCVDEEGYILPDGRPAPADELVVLRGVDRAAAPLKTGRQQTGEAMGRALRLLARLQRAPELAGHRLVSIDAGDPEQLIFTIDDDVEIRCGGEADLAAHLDRLHVVLKQVASRSLSIRYIDVRFHDPVIAPKT